MDNLVETKQYAIVSVKTVKATSLEDAQEQAKKWKQSAALVFPTATTNPLEVGHKLLVYLANKAQRKALATVAGGLIILMLTATMFGRDHEDWKQLTILQSDSQKIGTATEGHRFGAKRYIDVEGHVFGAKMNGNFYQLSSRKEMIEPGLTEGAIIDHGRKMKVRDGRRELVFNIDSVRIADTAPVAAEKTKVEWENTTMKKDAQADPSKFIITQTPGSHLAICVETLTMRDGSQTCLHWADRPAQ